MRILLVYIQIGSNILMKSLSKEKDWDRWKKKNLLYLLMSMWEEHRSSRLKKILKKWYMFIWHGLNFGVDPSNIKIRMNISLDAISFSRYYIRSRSHLLIHLRKIRRNLAIFHTLSFKPQQHILVSNKLKSFLKNVKVCSKDLSIIANK